MRGYLNHARRHAAGGSDPIAATGETFVIGTLGTNSAVSVTTPWNYNNLIPMGAAISTTDATVFAKNGTYSGGINILQTGRYDVHGIVQVSHDNTVSHLIPSTMELVLVFWTTASGSPSGTTNRVSQTHRNWLLPASSVDTNLDRGNDAFWMSFCLPRAYQYNAGKSYGIWFHATDATDNWQIVSAELVFSGSVL